jgi:putative membrane protein
MKALLTFALVILLGISAFAITDDEITEIMKTANNAEIDAGKVAKKNAADGQVKEFADMMIKDHEDNLKHVKDLSKVEKIKMKSSDDSKSLKKDASDKLSDVKKKKGLEFDKAYMQMQVDMHKQLLADLDNKLIPQAQNQNLKIYLQSTRESVQKHHAKAEEVLSSLK